MTVTVDAEPRTSTPVPQGRGRWRLTLHRRVFMPLNYWIGNPAPTWNQTIVSELSSAHDRKLTQKWDGTAELAFSLDGRSDDAANILELAHDVYAWRWSTELGRDVCVFRGPIQQADDTVTPERHAVTFTCHDYLSMLERRILTSTLSWTNVDQDTIVSNLLTWAAWLVQSSSGTANFNTAGFLPIQSRPVDPSGNPRGASGQIRQRTYYGNATYLEQLDLLSKVAGGFDYDVQPEPEAGRQGFTAGFDAFRVFYPYQGSDRTAQLSFVYGSNVASVQRSFSSVDFANYVRELGNNSSADPNVAQLYAEAWTSEATSTTPTVGLWMLGNNLADINLQTTLNEHAQGDIGLTSLPAPTYTVGLTPDTYRWGNPAMGDNVPLIVQSGRLNINTTVRVLGITYTVGNDGQETVDLTVGRPQPNLRSAFHRITRDINALTRR